MVGAVIDRLMTIGPTFDTTGHRPTSNPDATATTDTPPMDPTHLCELVERHEISTVVPDREPNIGDYQDVVDECRYRALKWADAHGLELGDLRQFTRTAAHHNDGPAVGVTFTVTVGRGVVDTDQSVPGLGDRWQWSSRRDWWLHRWRGSVTTAHLRRRRPLTR